VLAVISLHHGIRSYGLPRGLYEIAACKSSDSFVREIFLVGGVKVGLLIFNGGNGGLNWNLIPSK